MKKFISKFKNINEDRINMRLIDRDYGEDMVESVIEVFQSLETIPSIIFVGYTVEYDESKINFAKYITSRKRKKKRDKNTKFHYIKPDRACEVTMTFKLSAKGQVKVIKKSILVPLFNSDSYVTLKGKRYFLLYQLVDSSTYVSKMGLTMKSLMPIKIMYRDKPTVLVDTEGTEHSFVTYYMRVFKRDISVLLFFFCRMGFHVTLRYFILDKIMGVITPEEESIYGEDNYYFAVNKNMMLWVDKQFFDKYDYVQAMTGMIHETLTSKVTMDQLESELYWLEQLGGLYTNTKHKKIESGRSTLLFFERLLDVTTKKTLNVSKINKVSVYSVIRWMLSSFPELRQKSNMDLNTKRLRLTEYVAAMLNLKLGDSINRVLGLGTKATIAQIQTNLFRFSGTIVLQVLGSSQLLKFDDRTNDLDFVSRLRFTVKGPNSIGQGKNENIGVRYRGTDVSYLGNIDLNVYSSSSPGLNGSLTPFAHTQGLYFNAEPEYQNREYELMEELDRRYREQGYETIDLGEKGNPVSYYDAKYSTMKNMYNNFKVSEVEDPDILTIEIDEDDQNEML